MEKIENERRATPSTPAAEALSQSDAQDQASSGGTDPVRPAVPQDSAAAGDLPADLPCAYRKAVAERQDLYDRLLRKQAELENFRKRVQNERDEFLKHATADLIRSLLPALDAFDRALKQRDPKVPEQFYEGVALIQRELMEILHRAGLTVVETSGKLFDPHLHQAVETVETAGHRDQEIVEELQRGYKLRHRLLRPAIVKVAVSPKSQGSGTSGDE